MSDLPSTMRAAVYHGQNELAIEDVPLPEVGPHEVLLSVSHCGICGSDLHFVLEGWGRPGSIEGHEWSGRVVAVGSGVTRWAVGDELVGGPSPRCGECAYCRDGRPSLCTGRNTPGMSVHRDGAFAEYVRAHEDGLLRIPDGVGMREAALAEPLAVALHGLTRGVFGRANGCSSPVAGRSGRSVSPPRSHEESRRSWSVSHTRAGVRSPSGSAP